MFDHFSQFLKGSSAPGALKGPSAVSSFTKAFKDIITGANQDVADSQLTRRGFRTKTLKTHLPFIRSLSGWGSYRVGQTKYPSCFSFIKCREIDMSNKVAAQEKRDRKNKARLAQFAKYATA